MMSFYQKIKNNDGRRDIYLYGIKIFSYKLNTENYCYVNEELQEKAILPYEEDKENAKLFIIYGCYYQHNDFSSFDNLLKIYDSYSDDLKQRVDFIFVDDCSTFPLSLPTGLNLNATLLRVLEDKKWNSCGARNLGACYATTKKIILSDLDRIISEETIRGLVSGAIGDNEMIRFRCVETQSIHPNIFAMLKKTFLNVNGYDEDIVGIYGDDVWFRRNLVQNNIHVSVYGTIHSRGQSLLGEHHLNRKHEPLKKYLAKKKEHTRQMLNFPWKFVESISTQKRNKEI